MRESILVAFVILSPLIGALAAGMEVYGKNQGVNETMQQAHERGYAVECVGKTGYHWECEE